MAKTKKINFDLFELSIKNNDSLTVESLFKLSSDKYNPLVKENGLITLGAPIKKSGSIYTGYLIHTQMYDIPPAFDIKKHKLSKLNLNDDQGLAHTKSFLFDSEINVVLFEAGMHGVTFNSFCEFFETTSKVELESAIVIDPSKMQKYKRLDLINTFEVSIARVKNGTIFQGEEAISDIIKLAEESNSKKIYYKLQSNRKDTLNVGLIRNLVNIFSRYKENNEIKKLVVSGREGDEDKNTHIDLIVNRLKLEIETSLKRNMDLLLVNAKIDQMTKAYNSIRSELLKVYKSE